MLVGWYSETALHLLAIAKEMKLSFTLFLKGIDPQAVVW